MEVDISSCSSDKHVLGKDNCVSSLLQKHCLMNTAMAKFHSQTLPKISNEYHSDYKYEDEDVYPSHILENGANQSVSFSLPKHGKKLSRKLKSHGGLSVQCLQSYEDLKNLCKKEKLKFVDCSGYEHKLAQRYKLKRCSVKCLQSLEDLRNTCEKQNLKLNSVVTYEEYYEVDLILADKLEEGVKFYFVKWKNYDLNMCTWEPRYHLTIGSGCKLLVCYYDYLKSPKKQLLKDMIRHFVQELICRRPYDVLTLSKLCSLIYGYTESHITNLPGFQLKNHAKSILNMPISDLNKYKNQLFDLMQFSEARKHVLINLKEWEKKINADNPATYIEVENDVDLENVPSDFEFIHDYVCESIYVSSREEPVAFCDCKNCYESKNKCCPHNSDGPFPYNRYGRLLLLPGYPIYECNKKCKCGPECFNRVVQHGQKIKVAIFRTSNGCGWGLKALEAIPKDMFVLEYLGEILTTEDAETRGNVYDSIGRSYLFDLDYGERNCQFTIDAGCVGNAAHFINHSCDPNLHVFAVWINNQDPRLPRLAFFAKKKINRGEELTFDYKMVKNSDKYDSESPIPGNTRMECKCNSKNCRKYLF